MDASFFQIILQVFDDVLRGILQDLDPYIFGTYVFCLFMDIVSTFYRVSILGESPIRYVSLVMRVSVLLTVIQLFPNAATTLLENVVKMGLAVTHSPLTAAEFLDPGRQLKLGYDLGSSLLAASGGWTILGLHIPNPADAGNYLVMTIAWFFFEAGFAVQAIILFLAEIEVKLAIPVLTLLLPFYQWQSTRFMTQGVVSWVARTAVRFFVLTLISSIVALAIPEILRAPTGLVRTGELGATQASLMILFSWVMAALFIAGPRMARSLMSGSPTFSGEGPGRAVGSGIEMVGRGLAPGATAAVQVTARTVSHVAEAASGQLRSVAAPPVASRAQTLATLRQGGKRV